jgi:putative peptidoglycan lipid II flippase
MSWPMHDAGPTTPEPGRGDPGRGGPGGEQGRREETLRTEPDPGEFDDYGEPEDTGPRRGRHSAPDPLPPLEGPMLGGGPTPAETTLPLALNWPAPPARPPRGRGTQDTGATGVPAGWRRVGRPGAPPDQAPRKPTFTPHQPGSPPGRSAPPRQPTFTPHEPGALRQPTFTPHEPGVPGISTEPLVGARPPRPQAPAAAPRSSLIRSSAGMAVGTLASRVTGFLRTFVFVAALGTGPLANDYNNANTLPNTVYYLMLGGIFTSVVVPLLVKAAKHDPDHGEAYAQRMFTMGVVALLAVTVVGTALADPLVSLYAPTIHGAERNLMVVWAYFFIPQIFFYGMSSLIAAVLNTRGSFAAPMWTPVVNNVVVIAVGGLYVATFGLHQTPSSISSGAVQLLGFGTTLGIVLQTIVLLPALRQVGFKWHPDFAFRRDEVSEIRRMTGWMAGYVITQWAGNLVAQIVANTTSSDPAASTRGYSAYTYSWMLFQLPYAIIGISVITALLPRMSEHADIRRYSLVRNDFSTGVRLSSVIVVPAAIFLAVLGGPIAQVIFSYGSTHAKDAQYIGQVFGLFSLGLVPFMLTQLQLRVFYSFHDSRTAAFVGLLTMTVGIVGDLIALGTLSKADLVAGLAVAYGVANLFGAIAGWILLLRRVGSLDGWAVARSLARMHLATVPGVIFALLVMYGGRRILHNPSPGYGLFVTIFGGGGAVLLYAICARKLRVAEFGFLMRTVAGRFGGQSGRH